MERRKGSRAEKPADFNQTTSDAAEVISNIYENRAEIPGALWNAVRSKWNSGNEAKGEILFDVATFFLSFTKGSKGRAIAETAETAAKISTRKADDFVNSAAKVVRAGDDGCFLGHEVVHVEATGEADVQHSYAQAFSLPSWAVRGTVVLVVGLAVASNQKRRRVSKNRNAKSPSRGKTDDSDDQLEHERHLIDGVLVLPSR